MDIEQWFEYYVPVKKHPWLRLATLVYTGCTNAEFETQRVKLNLPNSQNRGKIGFQYYTTAQEAPIAKFLLRTSANIQ